MSSPVEIATRRLASSQVDTENQTTSGTYDEKAATVYGYDQAGNVLSMTGETINVVDQVECFRYDHLRRLKDAWTEASLSCATPQRTGVDPYRLSWTYDLTGNRKTQTSWSSPTLTTTATSTYPAAGGTRPHAVSSVAYTGQTVRTDTFTYNAGGYTETRNVAGVAQTLTWDEEGHLATTTQTGLTTSYVYDADGNRLIRTDSTGKTLYLGGTELRRTTATGQVDGTRHYNHNGATVAVRTITGLTWVVPDHHATNQIAINPTTLIITRRRTLPFGEARGTPPGTWPGDKGFVGGTIDPTGLTHIGAREYDPALGRFLSVDPLVEPADPQTLNAYAYGNNAPTVFSDPSGLGATEWNEGEVRNPTRAPLETVPDSKPGNRIFKGSIKPNPKPTPLVSKGPAGSGKGGKGTGPSRKPPIKREMRATVIDADVLPADDGPIPIVCQSAGRWTHCASAVTVCGAVCLAVDAALKDLLLIALDKILMQLGMPGPRAAGAAAAERAAAVDTLEIAVPAFAGGKTAGTLLRADGSEVGLASGWSGPAAAMPKGTPGMNIVTKSHVEAHAAAIMRNEGLRHAVLVINRSPCAGARGCSNLLTRMVPKGSRLDIIVMESGSSGGVKEVVNVIGLG